ncbi:hypothetical protein H6G45_05045 [Synechocystis sp. FACHB-383]|uniref:hypothetical protein n=1 Tax=Synechocystis sp. FACHB-383 TaxID=2692864 RepID=UPI0016880800|nr:hypothetical protein [Synechocystis sp. FACHB-383]MBD2652870.1 hypothetical protein [Synechocystis sp. FACHB-383]
MLQRLVILFSITTFGSLVIFPASAYASCQRTVNSVAEEIRQKRTSVRTDVYPPYDAEELANSSRVDTVLFVLATGATIPKYRRYGDVAANILYSKVLIKSYATRVFSSCDGTGYVTFLLHKTDWREGFMMTDNGRLGFKNCVDSPSKTSHLTTRISNINPGLD